MCRTIKITQRQRGDESRKILQSGDSAHDMELDLRLRVTEMLGTSKHRKLNVEMPRNMLAVRKHSLWVTLNMRFVFTGHLSAVYVFKLQCNPNGR
jgi:hypothetical protein